MNIVFGYKQAQQYSENINWALSEQSVGVDNMLNRVGRTVRLARVYHSCSGTLQLSCIL